MNHNIEARRYDIDWLRVLAFITLIFYHIGMFYVDDWGWHVKSAYQSEFLEYPMLLVNQWRMPLIFLISGFVLSLVEAKVSSWSLFKLRSLRILVPLIIGMHVIVPPQLYYQAIQNNGLSMSYWAFLLEYWNPSTALLPSENNGALGLLTWNHLWFLAYLWVYTLIYLALRPILASLGRKLTETQVPSWLLFVAPVLLMTVYGLWLKPLYPRTHALTDDWCNHALSFTEFLLGYFLAKSTDLGQKTIKHRRVWIAVALVCYTVLMAFNSSDWVILEISGMNVLVQFIVYANTWAWLLAVLGFAGAYLNRPSAALSYLNQAILPWYILHQTVTIVVAMQLAKYELGGALESTLVIVGTFVFCALFYEIIRRIYVLRFAFGMKLS